MAKKPPSIVSTLQKTAANASAANSELVRQLPVDTLEDNPLNRFSMEEDEDFQGTLRSVEKDGFLDDIVVTPAQTEGHYRIVSGHRRVLAARKLGKSTVPCKVRRYASRLEELRALMGANVHRRSLSPFDMARQLETLREVLTQEGKLPEGVKEQAELLAEQADLSRATVERYLDLLSLRPVLAAWAESGKMTMTDAYELSRQKNRYLQPLLEEAVFRAPEKEKEDLPTLIHRQIAALKDMETAPPPPKAASADNPLRTVDSFGRSIRRSTSQLKTLRFTPDADKAAARKKLETCLLNLEELRRTVEELKATLEA